MRTFLFFTLCFCLSARSLFAQTDTTTYWKKYLQAGANLNQAAFSSNWKAGGVNSIAYTLFLNARANYQKGNISWDNDMQLQYGAVKNAGEDLRKSLDRIFIDTKVGYRLSPKWNAYAGANFISQFARGFVYNVGADGRDSLISNLLSPGFLTFSLGFEYKPVEWFYVRLSPFAPRFTFLTDDAVRPTPTSVAYGVDPGKSVRTEWLAAQIQSEVDRNLTETLNLKARYLMYANYETLAWNTIDHRLDVTLTAKVTRYINVSLTGIALYDRDQDSRIQYSQALALGILYTIKNYADDSDKK